MDRILAHESDRERDLDSLRKAAVEDGADAMASLAAGMLIGRGAPLAPYDAVELLERSMALGSAEASETLATLTAAGVLLPQSWHGALELLARAAAGGSARARRQLEALGGEAPGGDWSGLAGRIDLDFWLKAPERRTLCEAPRIRVVDGFAPLSVCAWITDMAWGRFTPSMMFDGQKSIVLGTRTCSDFVFDIVTGGLLVVLVRAKITALTRLPAFAMEPPQVFHYAPGQEFKPHYDFLYDGRSGYGAAGDYHGDRIATFLLYLNDLYEGGELDFPRAGVRHRGRAGDAVYFANVDAEGQREPNSLHAGLPVTRGEKLILSQWIHDRPFTASL
jgi:hypothetical protein